MLDARDYKHIKMALRVLHALYSRNPKPVLKLILKQKPSIAYFGSLKMLEDTAVAVSELMLHVSQGKRYQAIANEIDQALKAGTLDALIECEHTQSALELVYRVGILQFDRIIDYLPISFDNNYLQCLKETVDNWSRVSRPGIYSDKIAPLYCAMYETSQRLKQLNKKPSEMPGISWYK